MTDIESFAVGGPQWVGGEWLDGYEFDVLDDLAGCDMDPLGLACDMWPDDWPLIEFFAMLRDLEERGFIRRVEVDEDEYVLTLTEKGAEPFGGLS